MPHNPEKSLFKEALGAQERIEEAKREVVRAKEALTAANYNYGRASAELGRLLEEGQKENTAELQSKAEKEHFQILRTELETATRNEDYEQVGALAKKIMEIKGRIGEAGPQQAQEGDPLSRAMDEFLSDNRITSREDQAHYRHRAKFIASKAGDGVPPHEIIDALQREFEKGGRPKAVAGWVGHHRR